MFKQKAKFHRSVSTLSPSEQESRFDANATLLIAVEKTDFSVWTLWSLALIICHCQTLLCSPRSSFSATEDVNSDSLLSIDHHRLHGSCPSFLITFHQVPLFASLSLSDRKDSVLGSHFVFHSIKTSIQLWVLRLDCAFRLFDVRIAERTTIGKGLMIIYGFSSAKQNFAHLGRLTETNNQC